MKEVILYDEQDNYIASFTQIYKLEKYLNRDKDSIYCTLWKIKHNFTHRIRANGKWYKVCIMED